MSEESLLERERIHISEHLRSNPTDYGATSSLSHLVATVAPKHLDPSFAGTVLGPMIGLAQLEQAERCLNIVKPPENIQIKGGELTEFKLFQFLNWALVGEAAALVSENGELVVESSLYSIPIPDLIDQRLMNQVSELPIIGGRYLHACGHWGDGFWHWMTEWLPKIYLAELCGFDGQYIVRAGGRFIAESLDLLGIAPERIVRYHGVPARYEELILSSRVYIQDFASYPGFLESFKGKLVEGANKRATYSDNHRRIYLVRNMGRGRCIENESEVVSLLGQFGFAMVDTDALSLPDQIKLMSEADVLVGPHGAGFTHILFMHPKSLVIECFSDQYIVPAVLPYCRTMGHRYFMQVAHSPLTEGNKGGINVNIELLRLTLERELQ